MKEWGYIQPVTFISTLFTIDTHVQSLVLSVAFLNKIQKSLMFGLPDRK